MRDAGCAIVHSPRLTSGKAGLMAFFGFRGSLCGGAAVLAVLCLTQAARAVDPPPLLPVQGFLSDASGTAITGTHDLRFTLYSSDTATTPLYTETHAGLAIAGGNFAVYLGQAQALGLSLFRDNSSLWLEVVVDGAEIIQPRVQVATAPYAGSAQYCGDAVTLGGNAPSAFALANHTHSFASLTNIPPGLADGDNDLLATLACANGQVPKYSGSAWGCGNDTDTLASLGCTTGQLAELGAGVWGCATLAPVATAGNFASLTGVPAGLLTGAGTSGYLPRYTGTATLATSNVYQDGAGNVGIGTTTPAALVHVNGNVQWGGANLLDATGVIELGDSGGAATTPHLDFHYGISGSQDYNVRIINPVDGELRIRANTLHLTETTATAANILLGYSGNSIAASVVGATVSGGGTAASTDPGIQSVTGSFGTIGGGQGNTAGAWATVGGGRGSTASGNSATVGGGGGNNASNDGATVCGGAANTASGIYATLGGGTQNSASGSYATIAGGLHNTAAGDGSFAAGSYANANNQGCFVWSDGSNTNGLNCNTNYAWLAAAAGGVTFYTNPNRTTGVSVAAGGGSWSSVSDRNVKRDITPIDPHAVLAALEHVPVSTWRYESEVSGAKHMGPMAQDFHAAFGLGDSDKNIVGVDADGVALAAVEGLHAISKEHAARLDELTRANVALATENAELRARLDRIESRLGPEPISQRAGVLGGAGLGLLGLGWAGARRRRDAKS